MCYLVRLQLLHFFPFVFNVYVTLKREPGQAGVGFVEGELKDGMVGAKPASSPNHFPPPIGLTTRLYFPASLWARQPA